MPHTSLHRSASRASILLAASLTALCCALPAQASNNGWQAVASGCAIAPQSMKLALVSTKSGALSFKAGKVGNITAICPVNFEFPAGSNTYDQLELMSFDNSPNGSVKATLMRKDRLSGAVQVLTTATSVDSATIARQVAGFTATSINFFTHGAYVVLQLDRSDPGADVQAHMSFLSRFIP